MTEYKFIADLMLGRLAKWLRIWGYDTEYYRDKDRKGIIIKSLQEKRIILTRDNRLSKKKAYNLILIRSNFFVEQLKQLKNELNIEFDKNNLFTRCTICNIVVNKVNKKDVLNKVPIYIYDIHNEFSQCPICKRIYWPGTHIELLRDKIKEIVD
jgi:uncharacterized protein with PIN domain